LLDDSWILIIIVAHDYKKASLLYLGNSFNDKFYSSC